MRRDVLVSGFLDDIYAAAVFPERWSEAVGSYAAVMGRNYAHLNVIDLVTGEVRHNLMHGGDPDMLRIGMDYYFKFDAFAIAARDTMRDAFLAGSRSKVLLSHEVIDPRDLERTEYYADFLRHWGTNDMLSATSIVDRRTALSLVTNPTDFRKFEEHDKQLAEALWPDIDRAFQLGLRLGLAEAGKSFAFVWDHSAQPVLLLQQGRLSYANRAAERVLQTSSIATRSGQGLSFHDDTANAALRELTRPTRDRRLPGSRRHAAHIIHDDAGESWLIQMIALKPPERLANINLFNIDPGVFVILSPLNAASTARAGTIASLVTFTSVERDILGALADGLSIQHIARATDRSPATIRWHVKNMLAKSGLHSLADLCRFAAMLMPF